MRVMSKHITAPPMPLIKRRLWLQTRQVDIEQVIKRFENAKQDIPEEWREELELLKIEIDQC